VTNNSPTLHKVALDVLEDVTAFSGALVGTAVGRFTYNRVADRHGPTSRLAAGVAAGLVAAIAADSVLGALTRPLRSTPTALGRPAAATPAGSVDEVRPRIAAQVSAQAEHEAKIRWAWRDLLNGPVATDSLWHGYEDGTATYFLAPGLYLRYQPHHSDLGTKQSVGWMQEYTLESGEGTTVLAGPAHLLELLTQPAQADDQDDAAMPAYDEPPF
jgi:hypothetical protein